MKKMLLLRWPCLLQDAQQTFIVQNKTGSSSTSGNHHPSFLLCFWNWAEEKTVDGAKICGGAENVVKTENPANIQMDCSVLLLAHLHSLEARVYCSHT